MNFTAINTGAVNARRRVIVAYPPLANPSWTAIFIQPGDPDWNSALILPVEGINWEMTQILYEASGEDFPGPDPDQSTIGDI